MISRTEDTYSQSVDGGLDIMVELLTVKPFHKSLSHPQVTTSSVRASGTSLVPVEV